MALTLNISSFSAPDIYHRDYKNDLPKQPVEINSAFFEQCLRVTKVALPFIALYKPLGQPLSVILGSTRLISSTLQMIQAIQSQDSRAIGRSVLETAITTTALVCSIFAHPLGVIVTSSHDMIVNVVELTQAIQNKDYKRAAELGLQLGNNVLYFSCFFAGSLELSISFIGFQIFLGLYHSCDEFRNGNYLEGFGHLLMACLRGNQIIKIHHSKVLVRQTISRINKEIQNKAISTREDERLVTIAKKLESQLEKFMPQLISNPAPGCCCYSGDDYLLNVVAIAEKQERIENCIEQLKTTKEIDLKVHQYFHKTLTKLKQGANVPLPDFFHATREAGFKGILQDKTIKQSYYGVEGPGTYISSNNEGDFGYGPYAFAVDEGILVNTKAKAFRGRKGSNTVYDSLWIAVLKDIPVSENVVAYIDTTSNDVEKVKTLVKAQNLNIEVIDRSVSNDIHRVFDLCTKTREIPSFYWSIIDKKNCLPKNMYSRTKTGTFRKFMPIENVDSMFDWIIKKVAVFEEALSSIYGWALAV